MRSRIKARKDPKSCYISPPGKKGDASLKRLIHESHLISMLRFTLPVDKHFSQSLHLPHTVYELTHDLMLPVLIIDVMRVITSHSRLQTQLCTCRWKQVIIKKYHGYGCDPLKSFKWEKIINDSHHIFYFPGCQSSAVATGFSLLLLFFPICLKLPVCLLVWPTVCLYPFSPLSAWQACQSVYLYFSLSSLSVSKWEWGETGWGCLVEQRKFLMHDPSAQAWTVSCQTASSLFGFFCVTSALYCLDS